MPWRYIIGIVIAIIIFTVMVFLLLSTFSGNNQERINLVFWGVFDDQSLYSEAIKQFEKDNPNVSITYKQFNFEEYEETLVNGFASVTGPDIWLMHNTWLPKHINKIEPMPIGTGKNDNPYPLFQDFENIFVDVVIQDLTTANRIYAVPLYVDTLALYYNRDLFNDVGLTKPPRTWDDFNNTVRILTKLDPGGSIVRSGASIGTARNINRSTDLLMNLMIQTGTRMTDIDNTRATFTSSVQGISTGETSLRYYTDFANPDSSIYTWDDQSFYSIDAFVQGKSAMMFNYSHQIPTIRDRSARFNFSVVPIPQLKDALFDVTYANYWAPTVSKQSGHSDMAWQFLNYLMSSNGSASYIDLSNRPSARRDSIERQSNNPDLGVFARQALSARSWYQIDNVAIETIFADMIDDVNFNRKTVADALLAAQNRVNVLMNQ